LSAIGEKKVDAFGAVQGAAAAKTDYRVESKRSGERSTGLDHSGVRVYFEIVKPNHVDSSESERRQSFIDESGGNESPISHQESATESELTRQLAETMD